MTKEHKINYCKGCKHRKINMEVGLVCSLTNKIGDFENSCDTFISQADFDKQRKQLTFSKRSRLAVQKMSTFLF
ncbi:MAG: hypothetical protein ACPG6V_02230 [Flavobacteriales bacterium]